jgi:hypothetical protein
MLVTGLDAEGATAPRSVAFDPAAAGLRLVVISARPRSDGEPAPAWTPDPSDDARTEDAYEALVREDWEGVGRLLTASRCSGGGAQDPRQADVFVEGALSTGALGARATSPTTAVALVPARSLRDLRSTIVGACAQQGRLAPRFLTTGALPPAVARPESLLETSP